MKKSLILVSALVVLAVLVGCNADQISGFGKGMEKIGDLGLGQRRTEPMKAAVENVKSFIADTEKYMYLHEAAGDTYDKYLDFNNLNDKTAYVNTVDQTVSILLAAKDSSARSKALRDALNAKYEGKSTETAYRNLYEGMSKESLMLGSLVRNLDNEEGRSNLVMILTSFLHIKITNNTIEEVTKVMEKIHETELPFPLQAGDYTIMIAQLFSSLKSIIDAVKTVTSNPGSGDGKKFNTEVLVQFQRDIMKSVGERDYQTVGDKIVVGIVFDLLDTIIVIDRAFRNDPDYFDPVNPTYDNFFEYVFKNGKGLGYVDKMLNYLDAISYIYDVKLDLTGLVSGMV